LPRLEITASGIDALFYVRNVDEQPGQREVVRAMLLPKDPNSSKQEIGAQRILSQVEIKILTGIAENPSVDAIEGFGLLEISQPEQLQIDNVEVRLRTRRKKEQLQALGREAMEHSSGVLNTVPVIRPARPE
jgi:GTP cyclohydrolase II